MIDAEKFAFACVSALNINANSDSDLDNALDIYVRAIEKATQYNAPFEEEDAKNFAKEELTTAEKHKAAKEQIRKLVRPNK